MKTKLVLLLMAFLVLGLFFSSNMVLAHHDNVDLPADNSTGNSTDDSIITCPDIERLGEDVNLVEFYKKLHEKYPRCGFDGLARAEKEKLNGEEDKEKERKHERAREHEERTKVEIEFEYFNEEGQRVRVKEKTVTRDGREFTEYKVRIKGVEVNSHLQIKQFTRGNETKFRVRGKGDVEEALNYLPDDIAEIARERLGSTDLNITLQEARHKNLPRVLYQIETNKHGKFLGVFKLKMKVEGQIDPETGEFLGTNKPWWAFLVTGEDDDDTEDEDKEDENENKDNDNNETNTNETNTNETNSTV